MNEYQHRIRRVWAAQYTGVMGEFVTHLAERCISASKTGEFGDLELDCGNMQLRIPLNHWLVHEETGEFKIYDPTSFHDEFEYQHD